MDCYVRIHLDTCCSDQKNAWDLNTNRYFKYAALRTLVIWIHFKILTAAFKTLGIWINWGTYCSLNNPRDLDTMNYLMRPFRTQIWIHWDKYCSLQWYGYIEILTAAFSDIDTLRYLLQPFRTLVIWIHWYTYCSPSEHW